MNFSLIVKLYLLLWINLFACPMYSGSLWPAMGKMKGSALVIGGLNLRSEKMRSWTIFLQRQGYTVIELELEGHGTSLDSFINVTALDWKKDVENALCHLPPPRIAVGYSLGATVLNQVEFNNKFEKQILIAPAFKIRWYTKLISYIFWMGNYVVIPSRSPKNYRRHSGTPLGAYRALFDLIQTVNFGVSKKIIFYHEKDELIDIDETIKLSRINNWEILKINNKDSELDNSFHHLSIDEKSIGKEFFKKMISKSQKFLGM